MRRFFYIGDVNIEYGGMFYALDTWKDGYVDCVRVQPCSDAGGPDNCFWVETITVLVEPEDKVEEALRFSGWLEGEQAKQWEKLTPAQRRHVIVDACVSYGHYDPDDLSHMDRGWSEMIRIGPPDPYWRGSDRYTPDKVLRAGTSLRNYARKLCR